METELMMNFKMEEAIKVMAMEIKMVERVLGVIAATQMETELTMNFQMEKASKMIANQIKSQKYQAWKNKMNNKVEEASKFMAMNNKMEEASKFIGDEYQNGGGKQVYGDEKMVIKMQLMAMKMNMKRRMV